MTRLQECNYNENTEIETDASINYSDCVMSSYMILFPLITNLKTEVKTLTNTQNT